MSEPYTEHISISMLWNIYHKQMHQNDMVPCDDECNGISFVRWIEGPDGCRVRLQHALREIDAMSFLNLDKVKQSIDRVRDLL